MPNINVYLFSVRSQTLGLAKHVAELRRRIPLDTYSLSGCLIAISVTVCFFYRSLRISYLKLA